MGIKTITRRVGTQRAVSLLAPALILLLAAALRFYRLAGQSLWSDEGNSVALAQAGLAEIAARTALDIHPPLYYWLLHFWMRLFGQSEVAVRSLSAVAAVLLVAVIYQVGARLFGRRAGLMAAFIAAVSPFQVYYAQEARMYALLALLGALTVWATVEWMGARAPLSGEGVQGRAGAKNLEVEFKVPPSPQPSPSEGEGTAAPSPRRGDGKAAHSGGRVRGEPQGVARISKRTLTLFTLEGGRENRLPWAILYILSAAAGLYTQYAFPVVLAAANLTALAHFWQTREQERVAPRLVEWLAMQAIPLALYLPWLPVAWHQLTTWPAPAPADAGNAFITIWRTLVLGPAGGINSQPWDVVFGGLTLVGVILLVAFAPLPRALLVLLYGGLPVGLTLFLFKPAYLKFLLVASPALCLLLGLELALWRIKKRVSFENWVGAGIIALAAWGPLATYYTDPAVARDDYRGIARTLEAVAGPGDAILLDAAGQQEVFGYYYRGAATVYPLPRQRPLDRQATVAELETILARARRIYALYWATDESDPAGVIEGWLNEHAFKATDVWVGNVRLVSYATPLPAADLLPADIHLGEHIALTGYRLLPERTIPGEVVQIQLRWTTDALLATRYIVFVQALDAANHLVGQRDAEPAAPSATWTPGQPVLDRHGLLIEPGTPPGEYRIIAGLYDATSGQRLPTPAGDFVELGSLTVERPAVPPAVAALGFDHQAGTDLGPLRLLGYDRYKLGHSYDPDTPLHAGDPLHVILYWQAQGRPRADWRVMLRLAPAANPAAPVAEGTFPAAGVNYPTSRWESGEIVRAQFDLFLPGNAPPGDYRVSLRLLDRAGATIGDEVSLASISVQ
jgi:mannosyltransferase